jgi:hypothetical protein
MQQAAQENASGHQMTRQEMDALQFQRAELKGQLGEMTKRRNQIQEQMLVMPPAERGDHALRIKEIDKRASDIDRQLMQLDIKIANGLAQPLVDANNVAENAIAQAFASIPPPPSRITSDADKARIAGGLAFTAVAVYALFLAARRFLKPKVTTVEESRRLDQLQQSVDVIALEVERMSESQRFVAKVLNEKFPALGIGAAAPVTSSEKDKARV